MNRATGVFIVAASLSLASGVVHAQKSDSPPSTQRTMPPPVSESPGQAAKNARTPGDLPSEQPGAAQISVPLKRKATTDDAAAARAATPRAPVDDDVARCLASKNERDRKQCTQSSKGKKATPQKNG